MNEKDENKNLVAVSLSKYLADCGVCSRRKAVDVIEQGAVTVNGKVIMHPWHRVERDDVVKCRGQVVGQEEKIYLLLNKPSNCLTTVRDDRGRRTVMDLLKGIKQRVFPVGRLDQNTTGLLLLTNDGDLAQKLAHPRYEVEKVYHVTLDRPLLGQTKKKIKHGLVLEDGPIAVDAISYFDVADKSRIEIRLHSGRNRIIRRIFEHVGHRVKQLERVEYAGLTLQGLSRGYWRLLSEKERALLGSAN